MPDDKTIRQPHDKQRIDIDDPYEVRNWCNSIGCTADQLERAVDKVGTSAEDVKKYLK